MVHSSDGCGFHHCTLCIIIFIMIMRIMIIIIHLFDDALMMNIQLNDKPELSPYFPDGTLCHQDDGGSKYYCQVFLVIIEAIIIIKSLSSFNGIFVTKMTVVPSIIVRY